MKRPLYALTLLLALSGRAVEAAPTLPEPTDSSLLSPAQPLHPVKELDPYLFPVPETIRGNVAFWTDVFTQHTSKQVLLHDEWRPERVYVVLDFTGLEASSLNEAAKRRRKQEALTAAREKYRGILLKLAVGAPSAHPEEEAHVRQIFAGATPDELRTAADSIRSQTGVADQFRAAIERSGRYLPAMEQIFLARDLPIALTRLPFIESMFQENARSKVAAGGMWQIMPATGRLYLTVRGEIDERYDPLLAAEAAAKILQQNYQTLGSWPLAITAYNHGTYGMMRAAESLGTVDFGVIYERWKGKAFGFASRNFYAELVAAATIYENRDLYFPGATPAPAMRFDVVSFDRFVPGRELASRTGVDVSELAALNPALSPEIWAGKHWVPAHYRLRVPEGRSAEFQVAYANLPATMKQARQGSGGSGTHRVRRGETLSTIGRRYGVSVASLQRANRMGRRTKISIGQMLQIPGRAPAPQVASAPSPVGIALTPTLGPAAEVAPQPEPVVQLAAAGEGGDELEGETQEDVAGSLASLDTDGDPIAGADSGDEQGNDAVLAPGERVAADSGFGAPLTTPARRIASPSIAIDASTPVAVAPAPAGSTGQASRHYIVQRGDTLFAIAQRHGLSLNELMRQNGLRKGSRIYPGQRLVVDR